MCLGMTEVQVPRLRCVQDMHRPGMFQGAPQVPRSMHICSISGVKAKLGSGRGLHVEVATELWDLETVLHMPLRGSLPGTVWQGDMFHQRQVCAGMVP